MQVFHSARRHGRALAIVAGHVRPFAAALAAVAFLVAAGARSSGPSWLRAGTTQAAAGDLDATFGTGGKQLVPPPAGANGAVSFVLGVGPDGRIWQVSRLTVAGEFRIGVATLDPADGAPLAVAGPDSPYLLPDVPGGSSQIGAIAFQPDGKVVLAGDFTSTGAPAGVHLVVRLTSTGSLDDAPGTGFGATGYVKATMPAGVLWSQARGVAIQDDKVIVAGVMTTTAAGQEMFVARYNADGTLDGSFGSGGYALVGTAGNESATGVVVLPDNRILVSGAGTRGGQSDLILAQLTAGGALDASFGSGGVAEHDLSGRSESSLAMARSADGAIVVSGFLAAAPGDPGHETQDALVARFDADGALDTAFDGDGWLAFDGLGDQDWAEDVAVLADGKVAVAVRSNASVANGGAPGADYLLYAFHPNGNADTSFGTSGRARTDFGAGADSAWAMAVQADGKIVLGGNSFIAATSSGNPSLARYDAPDLFFDADGDMVADGADNCPHTANADQLDTDGDGQGDACDFDDDNDGVADPDDNCALTANAGQTDTDGDGAGDACDADDDGDGVPDAADNCPLTANAGQADADHDGIGDACDPVDDTDTDGDGVLDSVDNCPLTANADQVDQDGDHLGDACDDDDDGDGIADAVDNCPLTPNAAQCDLDFDGIGDECDADDDGDGVPDATDNCPQTANTSEADNDGDGQGDACDPDDDNDGVMDADDNCPFAANPAQFDTDGDGIGDVCDADDDDDGLADAADNCPLVANADQSDNDLDGIGDACDADDDNDGVLDDEDNCPLTANPSQADSDGDGIGDACDPVNNLDRDGDGVPDSIDNCPTTANPSQADQDHDGIGDACDGDVDGDGVANASDNCPGDPNSAQTDTDHDGQGNACDADDDNDGVLDAADNCPLNANPTQADHDADGLGNACDADDDNDGVADAADPFPTSNTAAVIVIGTCSTGVTNAALGDGSTMSDRIGACAVGAATHGAWESCVTALTNDWKKAGRITGAQKGAITSCAAGAAVP